MKTPFFTQLIGIQMAKGLKCARCGYWMYAQDETPEGGKTRVYYVCRACNYATTAWE